MPLEFKPLEPSESAVITVHLPAVSIDGLAAMVKQSFGMEPFALSLFLFCGKRRDRLKALFWEGDGFIHICTVKDHTICTKVLAAHVNGRVRSQHFSTGSEDLLVNKDEL